MPQRPGQVICLIMTDGYENASKEWTWAAVEALITQQREQYNWKFIFLGANIDAEQVGVRMGVPLGNSMTYDTDLVGPAMRSTSRAMASARRAMPMAFTPGERADSMPPAGKTGRRKK